ncbi:hypothetical protein [Bacillus massilinigeriensis]|uniref:hypothetical protein n=1 Tax=Bacillus mediterraneensis TaxID=1805474 RepID=UPI0008F85261|nr:hypothetical protein [Bacillus mediterraneensis]
MKKLAVAAVLGVLLLAGCGIVEKRTKETMVLLDEEISEVKISKSKGFNEINEDVLFSFRDKESLAIFEQAITSAVKEEGTVDIALSDFDIAVEYGKPGQFPPHGIHLWLGEEGEKCILMYVTDDNTIYSTTPKMAGKLRELILSQKENGEN